MSQASTTPTSQNGWGWLPNFLQSVCTIPASTSGNGNEAGGVAQEHARIYLGYRRKYLVLSHLWCKGSDSASVANTSVCRYLVERGTSEVAWPTPTVTPSSVALGKR